MKTYKITNYKGNIVESLTKFKEKYPKAKIAEAAEENGILKVTADVGGKEPIKEAAGQSVFVVGFSYPEANSSFIYAICSSKQKAQEMLKKLAQLPEVQEKEDYEDYLEIWDYVKLDEPFGEDEGLRFNLEFDEMGGGW